jgi:hypothetical protein
MKCGASVFILHPVLFRRINKVGQSTCGRNRK